MLKIKDIYAREILDSRGNPTVEVELLVSNGIKVTASVPSGASTGSKEAIEIRDKDLKRYNGKGVLAAITNINQIIKPRLINRELDQSKVDRLLIEIDGTLNKSNLGANAILPISIAVLKALAKSNKKEIYEYISMGKAKMPVPFINIINGGVHASNNLDIQEFMIVPVIKTFKEKIRCASEIFQHLKTLLKEQNLSTAVGDEGGFAPNLSHNTLALDLIMVAIKRSGYIPGHDVFIAIDVAASELYNKNTNTYKIDNKEISSDELFKYYFALISKYPIISIEDPFEENDFDSFSNLTKLIGNKIMLVGDDYFVTNKKYLEYGINNKSGNAILIKPNQIGTITEVLETLDIAQNNNYSLILSHRSGETLDTFIADFAVGKCIPFVKMGSISRGERIAKYNRLMKIEENLYRKYHK